MREFTLAEVAECDGRDGRPVYIVHEGRVFDVTASKMWKGGLHMRRHHAGGDLTTDIGGAPHGLEVFERYPQVGVIRKEPSPEERRLPEFLDRLFEGYPFLRRHPHPMTVHFPIAFFFGTVVFLVLYLLTGSPSLEVTAYHLLTAALVVTPVVMLTGLFSWWLNYLAKPVRAVAIKVLCSVTLYVVALFAFAVRATFPEAMASFNLASFAYTLLVLSFAPLVSVIGWFGAKLTFPTE